MPKKLARINHTGPTIFQENCFHSQVVQNLLTKNVKKARTL